MSTLTRADNKRPEYKDYVNFLGSYKNGKRDDQASVTTDSGVSFSLTNSSNNSSSSVFSDLSEHSSTRNGYRGYLENLNGKKFSSVRPTFKCDENGKPKTVKTEMFINIGDRHQPTVTKTFRVNNSVSEFAKKFETKKTTLKKQNSIGRISQKFEQNADSIETHRTLPIQLKKADSIKKVSRVFQEENNDKKTKFSTPQTVENKVDIPRQPSNGLKTVDKKVDIALPPIPPPTQKFQAKVEIPVVAPASILPHNGFKPAITSPKPTVTKQFTLESSERPKIPTTSVPPPPPPLPPVAKPPQIESRSVSNGVPIMPSPNAAVKSPQIVVPPPPQMPPPNFVVKPQNTGRVANGIPAPVMSQNGVKVTNDVADGNKGGTIDRNDPRVKKVVYGALRGMYGAYHDKANDYLATLPKNRVRKNNGLDDIISSIASQGGLDKLTGRVNPNAEKE